MFPISFVGRISYILWTMAGFNANMCGPDVVITCDRVEEFMVRYEFRPYDFDGDNDVDLADFAVFQRSYDAHDGRAWAEPFMVDESRMIIWCQRE